MFFCIISLPFITHLCGHFGIKPCLWTIYNILYVYSDHFDENIWKWILFLGIALGTIYIAPGTIYFVIQHRWLVLIDTNVSFTLHASNYMNKVVIYWTVKRFCIIKLGLFTMIWQSIRLIWIYWLYAENQGANYFVMWNF